MEKDMIDSLYYTASEARKLLGLTEHSFQYWVKVGKINKTILPPKRQGSYLKSEIDRKKVLLERSLFFADIKDIEFKRAEEKDMYAECRLSSLVFGKSALSPEAISVAQRLPRISPESTWHLYSRDMLAASINFVPLTERAVEEFKLGKRGWLFDADDIVPFVSGTPLNCIIIDFIATPTVPPETRHEYAMRLLSNFLDQLEIWGKRGVDIKRVYANGGTEIGKRLLEKAGGSVIHIAKSEINPKHIRTIYEIDIESSSKVFLRPYKRALNEWKEQNTHLKG